MQIRCHPNSLPDGVQAEDTNLNTKNGLDKAFQPNSEKRCVINWMAKSVRGLRCRGVGALRL